MNQVDNELAAMQAVAKALSSLSEGDSRNRVLRWAVEHFNTELVPTVLATQPAEPAPVDLRQGCDPENLDSLFDDGTAPSSVANPVDRTGKSSVTTTISSFVADFQKLARDWQNA